PLFDSLADTLPEIVLVHTETILFANRPAAELFGLEVSALLGKPVTDLLRPAYRETAARHVDALLEGSDPEELLEVQLISGDEPLWAELHSRFLLWEGHHAVLTVVRDITSRKSLE